MKKLVFLAVVLIGITATSFVKGQTTANAGIQTQIITPADPNAGLKIGFQTNLLFGKITNINGGVVTVPAEGSRTVSNTADITASDVYQPATFLIEGAASGLNKLSIKFSQLQFPFGVKGSFVAIADWNKTAENIYTKVTSLGTTGRYLLKVGGDLHLIAGETGSYDISGLSVTVNME